MKMARDIKPMALGMCLLLVPATVRPAVAQSAGVPPLTAAGIAQRMTTSNRERENRLRGFHGCRKYTLQYTGFPVSKSAAIVVAVEYDADSGKRFSIVSEEGSHMIVTRVFKKLLEGEQEASHAESRRQVAVTLENYSFQLEGTEILNQRPQYVLQVTPRTESKFLYRGRIWVDAADFALSRISAEPAKNPSFWISHTSIAHRYEKHGEYWLPAQNVSTSNVRLGGKAQLTIDYYGYTLGSNPAEQNGCSMNALARRE